MKRLLVLGGTGRTGARVVARAIARGWTPIAFGRSARADALPDGAEAFPGDALDAEALERALVGADAVVSALSIPRASRSPFAAVTGPADLHSRSIAALVPAMERAGVRRLLKVSAQGVGDSAPRAGWLFRALVASSNLRPAFEDHARADAALERTALDWTIARPPVLSTSDAVVPLRADEALSTSSFTRVGMDALAEWILDALDDPGTTRRVLTIAP